MTDARLANAEAAAPDADAQAIAVLQQRFAQLNDAAQWQEVADLFMEDGRFTRPSDPTRPVIGRDAILQAFLARPSDHVRRHLVSQPRVEFSEDGHSASAFCHSVLLSESVDGQGTVTIGGFRDELRRTPHGWRFASRTGFSLIGPAPCMLPREGLAEVLNARADRYTGNRQQAN